MKRHRKKSELQICQEFPPGGIPHRPAFHDCPVCEQKVDLAAWDDAAKILVTREYYGKHGSVVVISECPKCFELSWVHQPFSSFSYAFDKFPIAWKEAVEKELMNRHVAALREWGKGLCWRCKHLEDGEVDTSARMHCNGRSGGPPTECPRFKEVK